MLPHRRAAVLLLLAGFAGTATADLSTLSLADASVGQGNGDTTPIEFTVVRAGDNSYPASVDFATVALAGIGSPAAPGVDYVAVAGTITLQAGEDTAVIPVQTLRRPGGQPDRPFRLELSNPRGIGFAAEERFAAPGLPNAVASGDFDGDGLRDVVTADNDGRVSVRLNRSTAAGLDFTAPARFVAGSLNEFDVRVLDLNGDDRPDLAVANGSDNSIGILLNTTPPGAAAASFAPVQTFSTFNGPGALASADFNRDGRPDFAATVIADATLQVLMNTTPAGGPLSFARQSFSVASGPSDVDTGDVDGDGDADIAVTSSNADQLTVFLNQTPALAATLTLGAPRVVATAAQPVALAIADWNTDGRADVAVAARSAGLVQGFVSQTVAGAPQAVLAAPQAMLTQAGVTHVAAGRFDADGQIDLAALHADAARSVVIARNLGAPNASVLNFVRLRTLPLTAASNPADLHTTDLDEDGATDILVASNVLAAAHFGVLLAADASVSLADAQGTGTILATVTPFSFAPVTGAARNALVESAPITVAGIAYAAPIEIAGGAYSIDGAAYTADPGTVSAGDVVRVRLASAGGEGTMRTATLTIGGVAAGFSVTTLAGSGGGGGAADVLLLAGLAGIAGLGLLRRRRPRPGPAAP